VLLTASRREKRRSRRAPGNDCRQWGVGRPEGDMKKPEAFGTGIASRGEGSNDLRMAMDA